MTELPYKSLPDLLLARAKRLGDWDAMRCKRDGKWISVSWNEMLEGVTNFGVGLYMLGIRGEDKVCILSENRPEWTISDLGIKSIRAITVPIHITSSSEQVGYYIEHSDAKVIVVSNKDLLQKIQANEQVASRLLAIVIFDSEGVEIENNVLKFEDMIEKGKQNKEVSKKIGQFEACRGDDVASILFTSGTTGEPRGVMLTQNNFLSNVIGDHKAIPFDEGTVYFSVLPMSHVFEISGGNYKCLYEGVTYVFSSGIDHLMEEFKEVEPFIASIVPRILEKIYTGILDTAHKGNFFKRAIFSWAIGVGIEVGKKIFSGEKMVFWLSLKRLIADALVFRKIRSRFGARLDCLVCGGAALPLKVLQFYHAIGIDIKEGYGLSETSPVVTVNSRCKYKLGTVGPPIMDVKVRIAEDGEILVKGPNVMRGYYKNEEATREAIDPSGWFHTGDIGKLDEEGFLTITDRKKEIFVLSTGKNVAPQLVESMLREDPFIEQAVVSGDGRSYLVALIVPDFDRLSRYAKDKGFGDLDIKGLVESDQVKEFIGSRVEKVNARLSKPEKVRRFTLLSQALTEGAGELTPTLKVKRRVVEEKYGYLIRAMYED